MAGQAWNRKGELNRAVLEHARALLLVLAVLVERAVVLPTVKRLWFLEIMGHGEAEARRLIVAMASDVGASGEAVVTTVDAMLAVAGARSLRSHACRSVSRANRSRQITSQFTPSPALRATSPPQAGERSCGVGNDAFPANGAPAHRSLLVLLRRGAVGWRSLFSQGLPLGPVALARPCR